MRDASTCGRERLLLVEPITGGYVQPASPAGDLALCFETSQRLSRQAERREVARSEEAAAADQRENPVAVGPSTIVTFRWHISICADVTSQSKAPSAQRAAPAQASTLS